MYISLNPLSPPRHLTYSLHSYFCDHHHFLSRHALRSSSRPTANTRTHSFLFCPSSLSFVSRSLPAASPSAHPHVPPPPTQTTDRCARRHPTRDRVDSYRRPRVGASAAPDVPEAVGRSAIGSVRVRRCHGRDGEAQRDCRLSELWISRQDAWKRRSHQGRTCTHWHALATAC
jgi:hypothetical protein